MASELVWDGVSTGSTKYCTIQRVTDRQMWSTAGTPGFEALTVANWANYAVSLTETPSASYFYVGSWPATLTTVGFYRVNIYKCAVATPDIADRATRMMGTYKGYWNGTKFEISATDLVQVAGTVQTARDLGAGVLLADGAHGGSASVLTLKQIDVNNSTGDAMSLVSSGLNGNGLSILGNGSGSGMAVAGGATGDGIRATGGVTSGNGFVTQASGGGDGLVATGAGAGHDIDTNTITQIQAGLSKPGTAQTITPADTAATTTAQGKIGTMCGTDGKALVSTDTQTLTGLKVNLVDAPNTTAIATWPRIPGLKKNTAQSIPLIMYNAAGIPVSGLSPIVQIRVLGGSYSATGVGTITGDGKGGYDVPLTQAVTNVAGLYVSAHDPSGAAVDNVAYFVFNA